MLFRSEVNGYSVDDVCNRTRIAKAILLALEEDRFRDLPAPVYLRGFLAELARLFDNDGQSKSAFEVALERLHFGLDQLVEAS